VKFDLQRFAIELPDNPDTSTATVGKDYKVYINPHRRRARLDADRRTAQQSAQRTRDTIDTSHKTSGGAKSILAGLSGWSIDLDGLMMLNDPGVEALEYAFDNNKQVNIKYERPDGKYRTGWGVLTDFSIEPPHDGEATLSGTIEGNGPLSAWTSSSVPVNSVTPEEDTFSKANPEDIAFTVTSTGTVDLVSLRIGAAATTVVNPSNYGYSEGVLTIEGDYLATLANGVKIFTLIMNDGNNLVVTVTVGD
jgi:TP901-1 family phage major tail protein